MWVAGNGSSKRGSSKDRVRSCPPHSAIGAPTANCTSLCVHTHGLAWHISTWIKRVKCFIKGAHKRLKWAQTSLSLALSAACKHS
eukprot:1159954-Pelagomonas_calceolata.AAC.9